MPTFLDFPHQTDITTLDADIGILGIPHGVLYPSQEGVSHCAHAPEAIRARSQRYGAFRSHYDFDLGGPLLGESDVTIVDCGDVPGDPTGSRGNRQRATEMVRTMLQQGIVPIVLGGDDSIPIPFFRAYEGHGLLTVIQVDAHIDWRDEVQGVSEGYSSPMRRAAEMPWIGDMFQVGIRGVGSARPEEVFDAQSYGAHLITAPVVHMRGVEEILEQIPDGGKYLITVDCDGFDPTIMPAVLGPSPGGLTFWQVQTLIHGLARKGRIAGFDLVELVPERDINGISALTAVRLIVNLIGALARGQLA